MKMSVWLTKDFWVIEIYREKFQAQFLAFHLNKM